MFTSFHSVRWGAVALVAAVLAGCGTSVVSKDVDNAGVPREVVFPSIKDDAWLKEGTWPQVESLQRIKPGVTKDQLYDLVGRPHFREGMGSVREWDYIFNFSNEAGTLRVCQYKVVFDKHMTGQTFHWLPVDCASVLAVAPALTERVVSPSPALVRRQIQLSGDALFAFGKSGIRDLMPGGQAALDQVLASLGGAAHVERLEVVGHTDRIGSEAANLALSQARAGAVADYFASKGVLRDRLSASGRGESAPVVQCAEGMKQALISCLLPNRRVMINAISRVVEGS